MGDHLGHEGLPLERVDRIRRPRQHQGRLDHLAQHRLLVLAPLDRPHLLDEDPGAERLGHLAHDLPHAAALHPGGEGEGRDLGLQRLDQPPGPGLDDDRLLGGRGLGAGGQRRRRDEGEAGRPLRRAPHQLERDHAAQPLPQEREAMGELAQQGRGDLLDALPRHRGRDHDRALRGQGRDLAREDAGVAHQAGDQDERLLAHAALVGRGAGRVKGPPLRSARFGAAPPGGRRPRAPAPPP